MRKVSVSITILIILLSFGNIKAVKIDTSSSFKPFKIVANSSILFVKEGPIRFEFDKKTPLIEFDGKSFKFYEIEFIKSEKGKYWCPKLDKAGNPMQIDISDKQYYKKVIDTITIGEISSSLDSQSPYESIVIGVFIPSSAPESLGWSAYYKTASKEGGSFGTLIAEERNLIGNYPDKSLFIADGDFNYEIWSFQKGKYKLEKQLAANPDVHLTQAPFLKGCISHMYFGYHEAGKGFLWLKLGDENFISDGKGSSTSPAPEMKQGKLAVNLYWLVYQLYGGIDYDSDTKTYNIYRLTNRKGKIHVIKIEIQDGNKTAKVDGEEYKLALEPYHKTNDSLMAPLRDMCYLLNAKLHWRSLDKTALIERFAPIYEREPLP